jgi:hypothetical protein
MLSRLLTDVLHTADTADSVDQTHQFPVSAPPIFTNTNSNITSFFDAKPSSSASSSTNIVIREGGGGVMIPNGGYNIRICNKLGGCGGSNSISGVNQNLNHINSNMNSLPILDEPLNFLDSNNLRIIRSSGSASGIASHSSFLQTPNTSFLRRPFVPRDPTFLEAMNELRYTVGYRWMKQEVREVR